MSNWSLYETRMNINGSAERDIQINSMKSSILNDFANSPSYFVVLKNGVSQGFNILEESIITKNPNKKRLICKPNETIIVGDIIDFNNSKWICTDNDITSEIYDIGIITRCNNTLLFYPSSTNPNENSLLIEVPCIVGDMSIGTDSTKYITTVDNKIPLTVSNNEITRQIKPNDIYKLGLRNYIISSVADDISVPGLLLFKMKYSEIEQVVPNYTLEITNQVLPTNVGYFVQLNVVVRNNDIIVASPPPLVYNSSDVNIATVSNSGLINSLSVGSCVITVKLASDNTISDSFFLVVDSVPIQDIYTMELSSVSMPDTEIKNGFTKTYTCVRKNSIGTVIEGRVFEFSVIPNDGVSADAYTLSILGINSCSIKCNKYTNYITLKALDVDSGTFVEKIIKLRSLL